MSISASYIGKPGNMLLLPSPRPGSTFDPSRGEAIFAASGGGTRAIRNLNVKRAFSLGYSNQYPISSDLLMGLYSGLYDNPVTADFVFVDSTVRNVLGLDASSCGIRTQAAIEWTASAGTVAPSTGLTSPVQGSAALTWTGGTNGATLQPGPTVNASLSAAPVYLPNEDISAGLYVLANAAYTVKLELQGYDITGAPISGTPSALTFTTSTSWQYVSCTEAPGAASLAAAVFVRPRLHLAASGSVPSSLSIAAAQLEYGEPSDWQPGNGSPRVEITSSIGRTSQMIGYTDHTLNLAER